MISFKTVQDKQVDIPLPAGCNLTADEAALISEIVDSLDTSIDDVGYAISFGAGCLLLRIFDTGRYLFAFPYEITADADPSAALSLISEYAMREELPMVFVDVPRSALNLFAAYRHMNIDAEDSVGESFRVEIKTECELISEIPQIEHGRVKLNAILQADIVPYAALCRNVEVNKFWGYDYREDKKNPPDEYFYENAALEFARGVSICCAIRVGGAFAGEAVIYAFDGRGGAEFAIRLLPEFTGQGLGSETVSAVIKMAKKIGLTSLYSKIMKENTPSVSMLNKVADGAKDEGGAIVFTVNLK